MAEGETGDKIEKRLKSRNYKYSGCGKQDRRKNKYISGKKGF
ncbi:MAG: hypothetical protein PHD67_03335 [Oscillospiraceae bacterium]|nr:hypothetical protein [Oscillospiraceae bacterium]